jgi:hypothetical protein
VNHAYNFSDDSTLDSSTRNLIHTSLLNSSNGTGVVTVKRESFQQHLPYSMEKQLAKNLQNIRIIPSISMLVSSGAGNPASNLTSLTAGHNNEMNLSNTESTTDSTSLPSNNSEPSLRDEDAWLPILNIAEEQVISGLI